MRMLGDAVVWLESYAGRQNVERGCLMPEVRSERMTLVDWVVLAAVSQKEQ
jgi:hypothetical protein